MYHSFTTDCSDGRCSFYISKETKNNKTFTTIDEINYDAKLAEIARMSSGIDLTQASLENAEEMLTNARSEKNYYILMNKFREGDFK